MRHNNKYSWLAQMSRIAELYEVNIYKQLLFPWPKQTWKNFIKGVITDHTQRNLTRKSTKKSSLKWLLVKDQGRLQEHSVWQYNVSSELELQSANIRARMITGRYKTQVLLNKINTNTSLLCTLCKLETEDTKHMIAICNTTEHIRTEALNSLLELYGTEELPAPETSEEICTAILNGGSYWHDQKTLITFKTETRQANRISNRFCFKLDRFRNSFYI